MARRLRVGRGLRGPVIAASGITAAQAAIKEENAVASLGRTSARARKARNATAAAGPSCALITAGSVMASAPASVSLAMAIAAEALALNGPETPT